MTKSVGIHEAKTHLSRLIAEVKAGYEITITSRGEEVARLVAASPRAKREFGTDAGKYTVPDDFDEPLPDDILDEWEGAS